MPRRIRTPLTLLGLLLLAACVTINVYFPASQAEQAAEEIVRDILQQAPPAQDDQPQSMHWRHGNTAVLALNPLDWLFPPAQAAQPDFSVETAAIRKLRAAMRERHRALSDFYAKGAIGFTREALVALRDPGAVGLKARGHVNNLLQAENRDRNRLYAEIAQANGHPEWEPQVRQVFARTWIKEAPAGWWYQTSGGDWRQK